MKRYSLLYAVPLILLSATALAESVQQQANQYVEGNANPTANDQNEISSTNFPNQVNRYSAQNLTLTGNQSSSDSVLNYNNLQFSGGTLTVNKNSQTKINAEHINYSAGSARVMCGSMLAVYYRSGDNINALINSTIDASHKSNQQELLNSYGDMQGYSMPPGYDKMHIQNQDGSGSFIIWNHMQCPTNHKMYIPSI